MQTHDKELIAIFVDQDIDFKPSQTMFAHQSLKPRKIQPKIVQPKPKNETKTNIINVKFTTKPPNPKKKPHIARSRNKTTFDQNFDRFSEKI